MPYHSSGCHGSEQDCGPARTRWLYCWIWAVP